MDNDDNQVCRPVIYLHGGGPSDATATAPGAPATAAGATDFREVLCSRIIQDRCDAQQHHRNMKFVRSQMMTQLVKHCYPDVDLRDFKHNERTPLPRPFKSPFPCFNCHRTFSGRPWFRPVMSLEGTLTEDENYCSGPCMNRGVHNKGGVFLAEQAALAYEYAQDVYGFKGTRLGLAPNFWEHEKYGGPLSEARFNEIIGNEDVTTHTLYRPFHPTETVIGFQLDNGATLAGSALGTDATDAAEGTAAASSSAAVAVTHHQWGHRGLSQDSVAAIEVRLSGLAPLEKKPGEYEIWLKRMDEEDAARAAAAAAAGDAAEAGDGHGAHGAEEEEEVYADGEDARLDPAVVNMGSGSLESFAGSAPSSRGKRKARSAARPPAQPTATNPPKPGPLTLAAQRRKPTTSVASKTPLPSSS